MMTKFIGYFTLCSEAIMWLSLIDENREELGYEFQYIKHFTKFVCIDVYVLVPANYVLYLKQGRIEKP